MEKVLYRSVGEPFFPRIYRGHLFVRKYFNEGRCTLNPYPKRKRLTRHQARHSSDKIVPKFYRESRPACMTGAAGEPSRFTLCRMVKTRGITAPDRRWQDMTITVSRCLSFLWGYERQPASATL